MSIKVLKSMNLNPILSVSIGMFPCEAGSEFDEEKDSVNEADKRVRPPEKSDLNKRFIKLLKVSEKISGQLGYFASLPRRMMEARILSCLSLSEVLILSRTSKAMHQWLKGIMWIWKRESMTIGSKQWDNFLPLLDRTGINTQEPPLPEEIDEILKSDCPFFQGKKIFETHKLVLIPGGMSIRKIGNLMAHLRGGEHETVFNNWQGTHLRMLRDLGDVLVEAPYWVLITNEIVPGSLGMTYPVQRMLYEKFGYEITSMLEATIHVTMNHKCSGEKAKCPLPSNPHAYTHCKEMIRDMRWVIGDFSVTEREDHRHIGGLIVHDPHDVAYDHTGVLVLRKFG